MDGLGQRLENLRDEKDLSERDVSKMLIFSKKAYGYYERGPTTPSTES